VRRRWRIVAALVAVGAIWLAWKAGAEKSVWLSVERRNLVISVPMEGELQAVESQQVGPPQVERIWNFQISMMATEGSEVEPGQPILAFDTTELQRRLQQAIAEADGSAKQLEKLRTDMRVERRQLTLQLAEAEARLRRAEMQASADSAVYAGADLRKARIDRELGLTEILYLNEALGQQATRERFETANLEGKLQLARVLVTRLEHSIERMTVNSERVGTVVHKTNWRGEKKQVGEQVWRAEIVLEIPDLSHMEASAEVDEANAGRLIAGQAVTLRLDAYPDLEHQGKVATIRRAVQRKSRNDPSKIVRLTLELDETDPERMRPGMRFQGTISIESLEQVVAVPSQAVFTDAQGSFVYVRNLLGRHRVNPQFGRRNQQYVEVLSGLEVGDRVLGRPQGLEGGV